MLVTITPRHGIFVTKWGKITVFIESLIVDFSFSIFYLSFYEFFSIFLNFLTYCQMHRTGKYHFASLAEWLSVLLRTKWLSVRISSLLFKIQIWRLQRARSSLTFRKTIDCGFTPKLVRNIRITYSLMHRTCKFSFGHFG